MKYDNLSKEELLEKVNQFEKELKGYVDRVDHRYKVFFERNLAGIYRTQLDGTILDCNDAMAQILGYISAEELIGQNAKMLYKDLKDREKHLDLLDENKFIKNRKLALLRKDGTMIWVSISTSEIINPKSGKIEYMEGTMIDITELIKTQEMLIQSEESIKKMLDESPYGIIIHKNGVIKYLNKRASRILGKDLRKSKKLRGMLPDEVVNFKFQDV